MNIGIHIETNLLACLFCLLLYHQQRRHKVFDFLGTTTFNSLLWACIFIMTLDSVSWFMMADVIPHTEQVLLLTQSLYYFIQSILPMFFMAYCYNTSGRRIHFVSWPAIYGAIVFTAFVLIDNFSTGAVFYVENNIICHNDGFWMVILAPMLYISTALVLCTIFMIRSFNSTVEKRNISFHMFMCVAITFIGALGCSFVDYTSPWHVFIASLIYLYMQLHGYRERTLDILAYTDSLTGLKNHAMYTMFMDEMNQKIKNDPSCRFAVVVMDVNDLKMTNDTYGHKAGDALIISASRLMCGIFQHSPVCRIGGDEFVAILENSDYEHRDELYRQFIESMKISTFYTEEKELPLSVALGMEVYSPKRHACFEEVFHIADEAMYEYKSRIKKDRRTS